MFVFVSKQHVHRRVYTVHFSILDFSVLNFHLLFLYLFLFQVVNLI